MLVQERKLQTKLIQKTKAVHHSTILIVRIVDDKIAYATNQKPSLFLCAQKRWNLETGFRVHETRIKIENID